MPHLRGGPGPSERIDTLIAETPDWRSETLAALRRLIRDADPEITEHWKWVTRRSPGTPVWEHDGMICFINLLKGRVRLTFQQGAHIPDPNGLFNARLDGNRFRAIDIYEGDELPQRALRDMIRAAVDLKRFTAKPNEVKP